MKIPTCLCLVAFIFIFAIPAWGQTQLEQESQQGIANVLRLSGIDSEIELTEQQHEILFGLWLEIKFDLDRAFASYKENFSETLPVGRKSELKNELVEAIVRIREKELKQLEDVLSAEQIDRLKQLRIQYLTRHGNGVGALEAELKLTPSQRKKIKEIAEAQKKEVVEIQSRQRQEQLTRTELVEIFDGIREKSTKDAMAVLTTTQRRKLKLLRGDEFDFEKGQRVDADEASGK